MSRTITAAVVTELQRPHVKPIILVNLFFLSQTVSLSTAIGKHTYNGREYLGAGQSSSISTIKETTAIEAAGIQMALAATPEFISIALAETYQGRPVLIRLGFRDSNNQTMVDPIILFRGRMDVMEIDEQPNHAIISMTVENRLIDLNRARERRYTDQDQKINFPLDKGLEFVASLQEKTFKWQ